MLILQIENHRISSEFRPVLSCLHLFLFLSSSIKLYLYIYLSTDLLTTEMP